MAERVLVVGSVAFDTVRTPRVTGERILGGSAVHFLNAAAVLGVPVDLVAVVGGDFGAEHEAFLRRKGADLAGLERRSGGRTFHWEGFYEEDMNRARTVRTELNVFESFDPSLPSSYRKDRVVFLANIDPVLQRRVLEAMEDPWFTVCDSMDYWIANRRAELEWVVRRVDVALFNEEEVREYTGVRDVVKAAREVVASGPSCVVVKRGEYGFLLVSAGEVFCAPAVPLEDVADPTGAGDSFAGGFVSYVARRRRKDFGTLRRAAVYGNLVASFNVQGLGVEGLDRVRLSDVRRRFAFYRRAVSCPRI